MVNGPRVVPDAMLPTLRVVLVKDEGTSADQNANGIARNRDAWWVDMVAVPFGPYGYDARRGFPTAWGTESFTAS